LHSWGFLFPFSPLFLFSVLHHFVLVVLNCTATLLVHVVRLIDSQSFVLSASGEREQKSGSKLPVNSFSPQWLHPGGSLMGLQTSRSAARRVSASPREDFWHLNGLERQLQWDLRCIYRGGGNLCSRHASRKRWRPNWAPLAFPRSFSLKRLTLPPMDCWSSEVTPPDLNTTYPCFLG